MMKEFNFEVLVCAPGAKSVAYEASDYLYALLESAPEYEAKSNIRQNLKTLLSLMVPEPPWSGPPISHAFGVTWGSVRKLLTGAISIAYVKAKGGKVASGKSPSQEVAEFLEDRESRIEKARRKVTNH